MAGCGEAVLAPRTEAIDPGANEDQTHGLGGGEEVAAVGEVGQGVAVEEPEEGLVIEATGAEAGTHFGPEGRPIPCRTGPPARPRRPARRGG